MRKRYVVFLAVMVALLIVTINFAINVQKDQAAEIVDAVMPEKVTETETKMKYPYSVETAKAAEETKVENLKSEMEAQKTEEPTPTPEPSPTEDPEPSEPEQPVVAEIEPIEEAITEDTTSDVEDTTFEPEDTTFVEEVIVPEVVEEYVEPEPAYSEDYYEEELPTPADEFEYQEFTPLGVFYITHYSEEQCGNRIGARERPGGMIEGESIAMPEWWMLGHTVYVENYGFFTVDDISPSGIADIFHYAAADAVGSDYQMVYLVG